jgi:hypothetical protein
MENGENNKLTNSKEFLDEYLESVEIIDKIDELINSLEGKE